MDTSTSQSQPSDQYEVPTLAGGCFWCLEAVFDDLRGVVSVESGYSGGRRPNPTYEQVCTGATGHAEVAQVTFDPREISCRDLLRVFYSIQDPTTLNQRGADVGSHYRSAIFYHSPEQKRIAEETIRSLEDEGVRKGIVTRVVPFEAFYEAEDYHQEYFANNPRQPYCKLVITPKVAKFRKKYMDMLKRAPAS